jgi:purine-binding chemotaxis protein CheW
MEINTTQDTEATLLVSTFLIRQAGFGVDANRVLEIVPVKSTTPVHGAPPYVRGVINLRGRVVTIIDAGEKIDIGAVTTDSENRIFIFEWKQEYVGLLVDRVTEVTQINPGMLKRPPENLHGIRAELITGVFKNDAGMLIAMVDIDKILTETKDGGIAKKR